jgi:CBS domain-containing protein
MKMQVNNILAVKGAHVVTIQPGQLVREAVALLAQHNIGALPVVDAAGLPVGIISERDIVRWAADDEGVFERPVQDLMTTEVIVSGPKEDLTRVARIMAQKRIRHLPIIEEGKLSGIISIRDLLKAQRDQYQGELETMTIQILADQD